MKNADMPAAPLPLTSADGQVVNIGEYSGDCGFTKREHGMFTLLAGILANPTLNAFSDNGADLVEFALNVTDDALAALEKTDE